MREGMCKGLWVERNGHMSWGTVVHPVSLQSGCKLGKKLELKWEELAASTSDWCQPHSFACDRKGASWLSLVVYKRGRACGSPSVEYEGYCVLTQVCGLKNWALVNDMWKVKCSFLQGCLTVETIHSLRVGYFPFLVNRKQTQTQQITSLDLWRFLVGTLKKNKKALGTSLEQEMSVFKVNKLKCFSYGVIVVRGWK